MEQTEKVAMTVMTDVRMLILLVMTTIVVPPESVLGGEVSVSRHFKGDIFSQQGNNNKILATHLVATENTPYSAVLREKSWTVDRKKEESNTEAEDLNFDVRATLPCLHISSNYNQICYQIVIRFVLMNPQFLFAN